MPLDYSTRLAGPVLALDLGGTNARAAVVVPDGRVSARHSGATPMTDGTRAVVDYCVSLLRTAHDEHVSGGGAKPIAVGIAAPGPLYPDSGRLIDPPNLRGDWWGYPLGPAVGDALGLPWALGKDTNVNILAERDFGAGEGSDDLIYLTISTGVGGAAISGGRPIVGPDGVAGELGHITVDMDGPRCGCGGVGHLEAIASGTGIVESARRALDAGAEAPQLRRIVAAVGSDALSAVHVSDAADLGDAAAGVILERARRAVAVAVVSIVNVFGPDVVILGGGIAIAWGQRLIVPVRAAVEESAFKIQGQRVRVVEAALGDDVGLIGSVPLVASALPGLVAEEEHDSAAVDPASATR